MVKKIVRQYNASPLNEEDMVKLLTVAHEYSKVKDYIYQRYSGIKSMAKVYHGYTIQQELIHAPFRETVNLPTIYVVLATKEAVGNIKGQWTQVRQQVRKNVNKHPDFDAEQRHYLRYVLTMPLLLAAILNHQKAELPAKFSLNTQKLNNYLCRQIRKAMPEKLQVRSADSFSVSPKSGYRYKNQGIYISTAIPRKRVYVPLTDKNIYNTELRIHLKPQENGLEIYVPIDVQTKPTGNTKIVGLSLGWHNMLVTDEGHTYGADLGKLQQRLAVLSRHHRHTASGAKTVGQKKYLAKRHRLEEQLHSYINHVLNLMLATEQPGVIIMQKMPPPMAGEDNVYRQHSLTLWQRGYIRKRLKLKCELQCIAVQEVHGKDISKICHICGAVGQKTEMIFKCPQCGLEIPYRQNAACNLKQRGMRDKNLSR